MEGTVAITDYGWYEFLSSQKDLDEVNFWTPSSFHGFKAEIGSPFFFKLKAKYNNAICGVGFFNRFSRLPDYFAWDSFLIKNGCPTFESMRQRITSIRERIEYHDIGLKNEIGCILLSQPVFFTPENWIRGPRDWPPANLRNKKYSLTSGEGKRIWEECLARISPANIKIENKEETLVADEAKRYGPPQIVQPRLGQGIFRVSVMEAYSRACAVTHEHSLPALEASHIKPFSQNGPHEVSNGLLLRADLHRLFDQGYVTITPDHKLEVSPRLRMDFDNGKSYYPLHGSQISLPSQQTEYPRAEYLQWHNEKVYRQ